MRHNKDGGGALDLTLFKPQLGWATEEVDEHVAEVPEEVDDPIIHFQYNL